MNKIKIVGYNLDKISKLYNIKSLKALYSSEKNKTSVYEIDKSELDFICSLPEKVFIANKVNLFYSKGSSKSSVIGEDLFEIEIAKRKVFAWVDKLDFEQLLRESELLDEDPDYLTFKDYVKSISYPNIEEYLDCVLGVSKDSNKEALIRTLAMANDYELEDFYRVFL